MKLLHVLPFFCAMAVIRLQAAALDREASIVVIGATPRGIAAAVASAREGRDVIITDHEDHKTVQIHLGSRTGWWHRPKGE